MKFGSSMEEPLDLLSALDCDWVELTLHSTCLSARTLQPLHILYILLAGLREGRTPTRRFIAIC